MTAPYEPIPDTRAQVFIAAKEKFILRETFQAQNGSEIQVQRRVITIRKWNKGKQVIFKEYLPSRVGLPNTFRSADPEHGRYRIMALSEWKRKGREYPKGRAAQELPQVLCDEEDEIEVPEGGQLPVFAIAYIDHEELGPIQRIYRTQVGETQKFLKTHVIIGVSLNDQDIWVDISLLRA